jgi:uncharacterized membrane protein YcaP (DUF421 family)
MEIFFSVFEVFIKSIISIIVLFLFTKIMGKKQVSKLTYFDYIVGITLGSVIANFALNTNITYLQWIFSMLIVTGIPLLLSQISMKDYPSSKILDGVPFILVKDGKIIEHNLRKSNLTVNDLLGELRFNKAFNIADVKLAILENSGKLSVLLKQGNLINDNTFINLIIDGNIIIDNLSIINKNYNWLTSELKKQNVLSPEGALLAYVDKDYNLYIDRINSDPPVNEIY